MVRHKTWAERLNPRGNLVLIRAKVSQTILTPENSSPFSLGSEAEVLKVGPGAFNLVRGERVPIEGRPGERLQPGQLVTVNPGAVFAPPEWKDERVALVSDGEIWTVNDPAEDEESEPAKSSILHAVP